jgi:HSP20 family molecular chaperone IbpA
MVEKNEDKDLVRYIHINGCTCGTSACSDDDKDNIEILFDIPGVSREDIHLKVIKDGLRLEAWRDKHTAYVSEYAFLCAADPTRVKAEYHDGELLVNVPLECKDPYRGVSEIPIAS